MSVRWASLVLAALLVAACTEPWQPPGLVDHQATLSGHPAHRLRDARPYVLPVDGRLIRFFCRFDRSRPLRVRLPSDATPDERRAIEAALDAWASAGIGVRFEPVPAGSGGEADIRFDFLAHDATSRAEGTGYTLADCRVAPLTGAGVSRPILDARLVRARIRIVRREAETWDADDHRYFAGETAGVALHELAHALGFQGHARFGGGILAADTREATRVGRAVLKGATFDDPTLRALYALPSGVVLQRDALPALRTSALDALLQAPPSDDGPYVRVGDRSGRIFWRLADGRERGVTLPSLTTVLAHPERLVLLPD